MKAARKSTAIIRAMALLLCAMFLCLPCGCWDGTFPFSPLTSPGAPSPAPTDPTTSQTGAATSKNPTPSPTSPATVATTKETEPSPPFEEIVGQLLMSGLENKQKEISLDPAVSLYTIPESDIQDTISEVFKVFTSIYFEHPEYFYLSGSINVSYSLLKGDQTTLKGMAVKPIYWDSTGSLSPDELDNLVARVDQKAGEIAADIRGESDVPWEQLQLLHDELVRRIAYDTSGSVESNQAASALLDGRTLCQGYAQSFQMIAMKLGFECRLISGKTDDVGHVWNLVRLDGIWHHVDVTHDDPTPDGGPREEVQHVHFLRSDIWMRETHEWEAGEVPACPDDGAHYYTLSGRTADSHKVLNSKIKTFCNDLDYSRKRTSLLELLYTGSEIPTLGKLENMISDALASNAGGSPVHFRYQISKSVVIVEVTTGG